MEISLVCQVSLGLSSPIDWTSKTSTETPVTLNGIQQDNGHDLDFHVVIKLLLPGTLPSAVSVHRSRPRGGGMPWIWLEFHYQLCVTQRQHSLHLHIYTCDMHSCVLMVIQHLQTTVVAPSYL